MDVLYLCNREKCPNCSDECTYTKDLRFAKNFELKEKRDKNGEIFMYAIEKPASNSVCLIGGKTK